MEHLLPAKLKPKRFTLLLAVACVALVFGAYYAWTHIQRTHATSDFTFSCLWNTPVSYDKESGTVTVGNFLTITETAGSSSPLTRDGQAAQNLPTAADWHTKQIGGNPFWIYAPSEDAGNTVQLSLGLITASYPSARSQEAERVLATLQVTPPNK